MKHIKLLLKRLFQKAGFTIHIAKSKPKDKPAFWYDLDGHLNYEFNKTAFEAIKIVRKYTMSPYINLELLYEQVVHCEKNNIQGAFVECGVWKGGAVGIMAQANLRYSKIRRDLHLFDIFEDICEPDPVQDGEKVLSDYQSLTGQTSTYSGKLTSVTGIYDSFGGPGSISESKYLLNEIIRYPEENLHFHKGWFQDTIPQSKDTVGEIAILRLDGDLYASIKICINSLYDKLVKGGIIIIDDYGYYEGCRNAVDEFRAENNITSFMNYCNFSCRYWIKE
jgi:O-methyltransferase